MFGSKNKISTFLHSVMFENFTAIFGVGLHGLVIGVISTALIDVINTQIKDTKKNINQRRKNEKKLFDILFSIFYNRWFKRCRCKNGCI